MLVGHILVDMSNWSARVLVFNPGSDVVVLPCVGIVVQVSAVSRHMGSVGWTRCQLASPSPSRGYSS